MLFFGRGGNAGGLPAGPLLDLEAGHLGHRGECFIGECLDLVAFDEELFDATLQFFALLVIFVADMPEGVVLPHESTLVTFLNLVDSALQFLHLVFETLDLAQLRVAQLPPCGEIIRLDLSQSRLQPLVLLQQPLVSATIDCGFLEPLVLLQHLVPLGLKVLDLVDVILDHGLMFDDELVDSVEFTFSLCPSGLCGEEFDVLLIGELEDQVQQSTQRLVLRHRPRTGDCVGVETSNRAEFGGLKMPLPEVSHRATAGMSMVPSAKRVTEAAHSWPAASSCTAATLTLFHPRSATRQLGWITLCTNRKPWSWWMSRNRS